MIKTVSVLEATAALILLDGHFAPSVASGRLFRLVPSLVTGTLGALEIVPALCCDSEALARARLSSKEPWFLVGVACRDHIPGAGTPTALGWSSSLGLPGEQTMCGKTEGALESCWPSPFHCRAQGFHGTRGPFCGRLTTLWSQALGRLLTKRLDSLSGEGTLLTTQGGAESGGGSRGFPDHPSVPSGCSVVTGVGFFPGGSAANRLYDYR